MSDDDTVVPLPDHDRALGERAMNLARTIRRIIVQAPRTPRQLRSVALNIGAFAMEYAAEVQRSLDIARAAVDASLDECEKLRRELTEVREARDSARAVARVLAHSYETDNRPPIHMVMEALAFPVNPFPVNQRNPQAAAPAVETKEEPCA